MRKPVYHICNNKDADQPAHPCCLCSKAGWFESYLVVNPEDRFSCVKAHTLKLLTLSLNKCLEDSFVKDNF